MSVGLDLPVFEIDGQLKEAIMMRLTMSVASNLTRVGLFLGVAIAGLIKFSEDAAGPISKGVPPAARISSNSITLTEDAVTVLSKAGEISVEELDFVGAALFEDYALVRSNFEDSNRIDFADVLETAADITIEIGSTVSDIYNSVAEHSESITFERFLRRVVHVSKKVANCEDDLRCDYLSFVAQNDPDLVLEAIARTFLENVIWDEPYGRSKNRVVASLSFWVDYEIRSRAVLVPTETLIEIAQFESDYFSDWTNDRWPCHSPVTLAPLVPGTSQYDRRPWPDDLLLVKKQIFDSIQRAELTGTSNVLEEQFQGNTEADITSRYLSIRDLEKDKLGNLSYGIHFWHLRTTRDSGVIKEWDNTKSWNCSDISEILDARSELDPIDLAFYITHQQILARGMRNSDVYSVLWVDETVDLAAIEVPKE
ncbi:MAG: hypothetical protein MRY64_09930 [Hyphomonadaceae bacterium]|nr:hypothetical protein [Hyphomonadaceae bacterium]